MDLSGEFWRDLLVRIHVQNPRITRHANAEVLLRAVARPVPLEDAGTKHDGLIPRPVSAVGVHDDRFGRPARAFEAAFDIAFLVLRDDDHRHRDGLWTRHVTLLIAVRTAIRAQSGATL